MYMTGACGHLHVPVRAFDMEQFCRMDGTLVQDRRRAVC